MGIIKGKWQEQRKAAQASGMSLVGYAAQHGINVRCLYDARHAAAKAEVQPVTREAAFVQVKPIRARAGAQAVRVQQGGAPSALLMQARLANGVVLSWTQDGQNAHAQANLLHTLAGLPCFA